LAVRRHGDHGAADSGRPDTVDEELQRHSNRRAKRPAGHRWKRRRCTLLSHQAAASVHFDVADPGNPPQGIVVLLLETRPPHNGTKSGIGVAAVVEIGLRHFTHITHQVGNSARTRIHPSRLRLDDETRQTGAVLFQPRYLLPGCIAQNQRWLIVSHQIAIQHGLDRVRVEGHDFVEPFQDLAH
jgi:hypothetical protein